MKRLIGLLCAAAMVFAIAASAAPEAEAASGEARRIIDIVYDDSGSMCVDGYTPVDRWSQALYAMEVFATMLGDDDEMNVFLMSDSGEKPVSVKGSDDRRVDTIVASLVESGGTPFAAVEAANRHIQAQPADAERWLVVLTDGSFQPSGTPVQANLEGYARQGISVVYLAIGDSAALLQGNDSVGFYTYAAATSREILGNITTIANRIFQQQVLPSNHISVTGGTLTLDIDIPVSQILVFAQGEDMEVKSLSRDGTPINASESNTVRVDEGNIPPDHTNALLAQGLCGVVKTYTAPGAPFDAGTYELLVSDASNVEIYYIAGVDIDCCLVDENGVEITSEETHYAGTYGIEWRFIDPNTGVAVSSDLLDEAVFSGRLTNGGATKEMTPDVKEVVLAEGEVELDAAAELPGGVTVQSSKRYTVLPEPIELDLSAQTPGNGYKLAALGPDSEPITVTVTNRETGEKLSQEEWDAVGADGFKLKCAETGVNWLVEKGEQVSTWEIRPDYITDMQDTSPGKYELSMTVEYDIDGRCASGSGIVSVNIADYISSELRVDAAAPEGSIDLNDIDGSGGALVTLYIRDEYTGEYIRLTQEQSGAVELDIQSTELEWELIPGEAPGVWELKPKDGAAAMQAFLGRLGQELQVNITVSGVLQDGAYLYEGSGSCTVPVIMVDAMHMLKRVLPYVVGFGLFLFLIFGYLCKKKLRLKTLHPRVVNMKTHPRKSLNVKVKRKWSSYLIPYRRQSAVIYSHQPAFNCRFANVVIRAAGGTSFNIVNLKSYANKTCRIDGDQVEVNEMKHRKFNTATTITCYGKDTKPAGEFSFS